MSNPVFPFVDGRCDHNVFAKFNRPCSLEFFTKHFQGLDIRYSWENFEDWKTVISSFSSPVQWVIEQVLVQRFLVLYFTDVLPWEQLYKCK